QSRFEGSTRQMRSRLLREIMVQPGITREELIKIVAAEHEAVERNLEALQQEGFLIKQGDCFSIAG
ncbi:MAG: A/G-specific adenine glycosylase, partial [Desulfuromonadaceae bacterium]|nr:A/G-specific adenine glycosylase [Desulfuromonadaceae bacterium]